MNNILKKEIKNILLLIINYLLFISVFTIFSKKFAGIAYSVILLNVSFVGWYSGKKYGLLFGIIFFPIHMIIGPIFLSQSYLSILLSTIFVGTFLSILGYLIGLLKDKANEYLYLKEKAELSNKLKDEFVSNMSHELRTPLNSIIGFSDLVFEIEEDEDKKEMLKLINDSGKHLLEMINDILDISKIEAGKITINNDKIDLFLLLKEIEGKFSFLAKKENINFSIVHDNSIPKFIMSDKGKLNQIFNNLISNAIKFTKENGDVIFKCDVHRLEKNIVELEFSVIDNGIGISKEYIDKIFDSFIQEESFLHKKYEGTGLGLTITKKFVKLMKGKINVKSEKNVGTTFQIILPFVINKESQTLINDNKMSNATKDDFGKIKKEIKIIVAEDDIKNQKLIKKIIEKEKCLIDIVDNGKKVLEKLEEIEYDLILLDIQMPKLNGFETLTKIKEKNIKTPVIALTAQAMEDNRREIDDIGFNAYITKPIDKNKLFKEINKLI